MPSNPTTKSQVQAYRFVLRRMQSALVRKDAVMLHDPLRTHNRATGVGVVIAALGLLGFLIFGILRPSPQPPNEGIVIGEGSGQVYVKTAATDEAPEMLIPTFNVSSARLLLMARQDGDGSQGGGDGSVEAVEPEVVPDDRLEGIERGRLHGIPDGPPLIPEEDQYVSDDWAVCDNIDFRNDLTPSEARAQAERETAVLAGVSDLGRELGGDEAILASGDDGNDYLIYRPREDPNRPSDMVRARVDLDEPSVETALKLDDHEPRSMSMGVLNAIPEVNPLEAPRIPDHGEPSELDLAGLRVGDVFVVHRADGEEFFVLLREGPQRVSKAVADMIRFEESLDADPIEPVKASQVAEVDQVHELDVDDYPAEVPTVLDPFQGHATMCLGWTVRGEGEDKDERTAVFVGNEMPLPEDEDGTPFRMLDVGQASPDGVRLDGFFMPPGHAAPVRAATSKDSFDSGPIYLISDHGLRYGIPDQETAAHLGVPEQRPAPDAIVRLLPTGSSLNQQDAMRTFDSVPVDPDAGSYEEDGEAG
ncbi:type VII secretion protein EccB [Haloechinothrix sp. YIM 98757]|uniref:Type VII secretion protein EccB n=1 Tax=Haloechinothrix aidingensis TaxID=2752311 RepID=A0A837ZX69_9PSEU|nr:type VII secretion protein EccB [Haloechinothrix aidingensis]MBA0124754.1 type VII secretion protein EccB [Haloechinothrix aidingensis]